MDVKLTIPKAWNDLSQRQLENIAYQFHCYEQLVKDNPETIRDTEARLFYQICKELLIENKVAHIKIAMKELLPETLVNFTKFIYDGIKRTKFPYSVNIGDETYYGPAQRLRNLTIGEFSFVDAIFYRWRTSKNDLWLTVLCASLYRKKATFRNDRDIRKPFVKQAVDARADVFKCLPLKTRLAIGYAYEGCRSHISNAFPVLFPKPVKLEGQVTPIKNKYVSFGEIVLDKIEGDPSKLSETNQVMTYDFLNILTNDINKLRKKT